MRYYKMTDADGNLTAIGTGSGGVEITEEEYAALAKEIEQKAALVAALAAGISPLHTSARIGGRRSCGAPRR